MLKVIEVVEWHDGEPRLLILTLDDDVIVKLEKIGREA